MGGAAIDLSLFDGNAYVALACLVDIRNYICFVP